MILGLETSSAVPIFKIYILIWWISTIDQYIGYYFKINDQ